MDKPKFYCFDISDAYETNEENEEEAAAVFAKDCNLETGSKVAVINSVLTVVYKVTNGVKLNNE